MRAMSLHGMRRLTSGSRWAWMLLLALWLPLAQGVAARHAVTHHGTLQRDAAPSALDSHCAQCLIAAPIGACALPSTAPAVAAPRAVHAVPFGATVADTASAPALAYRSRAPPSRLH
jgi:hypothetical protein